MKPVAFSRINARHSLAVSAALTIAAAALFGSAGSATSAGLRANGTRIDAVNPAAATHGAEVELRGGGFGAKNVRVWVGGVSAQVLSASGNRVLFRVPDSAPFGPTLIEAANPGDKKTSVAFTVLGFDGQVTVEVDESAAVTAPIGAAGGTINVAGMSLAIPPGAIPEGTTITATPLRSLQGSPFAGAPVGLKLEPSGLVLLMPATLTLPRPSGTELLVGFGFNGDGEGFHLVPHVAAGDSVSLLVWHFSGAGVLAARLAELDAVLSYVPTQPQARAEQDIARALADISAPVSVTQQRIVLALAFWYDHSVRHGLDLAATGPLEFFELAFGEWQAWLAYTGLYINPLPSSLADQQTQASLLGVLAARAQALSLLARCTTANALVALRNVIRLANAVNLASLPIESASVPDGTKLANACIHVELVSINHAATLARNRDNRFSVQARVVFYDGPASTSTPLRYILDDITNGPPVPITSEETSTGSWQTDLRPTTLGERRYDLTVELAAALTDDVLKALSAGDRRSIPVRERLELHARRAGDPTFTDTIGPVSTGGTVFLRIRLAGDNISAATITLTHDATGTLPATTTSDASGEAIVTYTAPASATIELINATVNDNGLTSGDSIVITSKEPVVVTVSPTAASLSPGQTRQFTATVTGTTNTAVTWAETGGTISNTGLYTAGPTSGPFTVTATSVADPTVGAAASVQISASASIVTRLSNRALITVSANGARTTFAGTGASSATLSDTKTSSGTAGGTGTASMSFTETSTAGRLESIRILQGASGLAAPAGGGGSAQYEVVFRVATAAAAYEITGPASVSGDGGSELGFVIQRLPTFTDVVRKVVSPPGSESISLTGTLQPGDYKLVVYLGANAAGCCLGSAAGSSNITVTLR